MIQKIHHDNMRSLVGIGIITLILLLSACKSDVIIPETPAVKSGIEKAAMFFLQEMWKRLQLMFLQIA